MIINRNSTIMNALIERTAGSMSQTMYQNSIVNMSLQNVNRGYNTVENTAFARGEGKPIVCGKSICGSDDDPQDEYCKSK